MNLPTDRNNAPAEGTPAELDAAYARASLADGSRPSLSARASILANAQREAATRAAQIADAADPAAEHRAQRIVPAAAANDSFWNWRAAAGFVGVAFAGVMALWLYRGNPEPARTPLVLEAPQPEVRPQAQTPEPQAQTPQAQPQLQAQEQAQGKSQPQLTADMPPPPAPAASRSPATAAIAVQEAVPAAASAPEPADKSALDVTRADTAQAAVAPRAAMRMERAADTATRAMAPPPAPAGTVGAKMLAPASGPSAEALLQRWFPQALDSDADSLQYWFVLDRNGAVLRSGQRAWTDLTALQRWLASDATLPRVARVESTHLLNSRGHGVELAYAWAAAD